MLDLKTTVCVAFTASAAAFAGWWTWRDPSLRYHMGEHEASARKRLGRKCYAPDELPQTRCDFESLCGKTGAEARSRSELRFTDFRVVHDPELRIRDTPWFVDDSAEMGEGWLVRLGEGDVGEKTKFSAALTTDGGLALTASFGPWSYGLSFRADLAKTADEAVTGTIRGWSYSDMANSIHPDGRRELNAVVGRVNIDSLDWTPGRTLRLHVELETSGEVPDASPFPPGGWQRVVAEGTATIEVPR